MVEQVTWSEREGRLPVVRSGRPVGMIKRKDILTLLETNTDLLG